MQISFSTGRRSFLTRGGGGVVENMAKNMGANIAENLERGPFGVFKGTILNGGGGCGHKINGPPSPPLKTPLSCIILIYNIDKVDIAKFKTSICNISQFLPQRMF